MASGRSVVAIIDDDAVFLRGLGRALARRTSSLDVALMRDPSAAIEGRDGGLYDLIVLDVYMPEVNGIDACRALRAAGNSTPVVVTSGYMTSELEHEAMDAGANYTLGKPFDLDKLLEIVERECMRGSGAAVHTDSALLIAEHIDAARNIARRLARRYGALIAPEDIDGLAMLGLCEAASRYDASRGEPFLAFALMRVRGAVIDQVRRFGSASRISYRRLRRISLARRAIMQDGEEPSDQRIADELGISETAVRDAHDDVHRAADYDVELLPSGELTPQDQSELAETLVHLERSRAELSDAEADVIHMRYDEGLAFAEIARRLEVTVPRVTQIHTRALTRLRGAFDD